MSRLVELLRTKNWSMGVMKPAWFSNFVSKTLSSCTVNGSRFLKKLFLTLGNGSLSSCPALSISASPPVVMRHSFQRSFLGRRSVATFWVMVDFLFNIACKHGVQGYVEDSP